MIEPYRVSIAIPGPSSVFQRVEDTRERAVIHGPAVAALGRPCWWRGRIVWGVVVAVVLATGVGPGRVDTAFGLVDGDDAGVHQPAVDALDAEGVFEGTECGGGGFCPDDPIQRWVMAVWLSRILDDLEPGEDPPLDAATGGGVVFESRFADVADGEWWAPHVERLAELGVTAGCATGPLRFCPDEVVTRGQMATFLVRAFGLEEAPAAGFADTGGNTHASSIDALAAAGVTAGCATGPLRFCPGASVTRGQMATFVARAVGLVELPDPPPDGDTSFVAVETGDWSACALAADGRLVCWGVSAFSTDERFVSVDLEGLFSGCGVRLDGTIFCWPQGEMTPPAGQYTDVAIASDNTFGCGLGTDRRLVCWGGSSDGGSSGNGSVEFPVRPVGRFTDVAGSGGRFCAVREDQSITCWGTHDKVEPWDVPDGEYEAVDVKGSHACGLRTDQTIVCWGKRRDASSPVTVWALGGRYTEVWAGNNWRVCGLGTDQTVTCTETDGSRPSEPGRYRYRDWEMGSWASCGVRVDGTVHCPNAPTHYGHHIVPGGGPFTDVAGRESFGCGLRADGAVACWGAYDGRGAPQPPSGYYTDIAVSYFGACGLRVDGTVACWGDDRAGQRDAPAGRFKAISRGWVHACGLRLDGTVACWGDNSGGQLDAPQGRFVDVAGGGANVRTASGAVVGPSGFSCGVRSDSTIVCWGSSFGALDPPDGEYTEVVAGWQHACGLRVDGSITCWLGGWTDGRIQPVTVPGPFKALDENGQPCGLRTDNTFVCWHEYYESGNLDLETKAENVVAYSGPFYVDKDGAIRYETGRRLFAP